MADENEVKIKADEATRRREARRIKILENSTNRLRKIAGQPELDIKDEVPSLQAVGGWKQNPSSMQDLFSAKEDTQSNKGYCLYQICSAKHPIIANRIHFIIVSALVAFCLKYNPGSLDGLRQFLPFVALEVFDILFIGSHTIVPRNIATNLLLLCIGDSPNSIRLLYFFNFWVLIVYNFLYFCAVHYVAHFFFNIWIG